MRNVFCVWALCAMLFCVAPGLAGAAPQLNEEALRSVVISRLGRVLTENGQDAVARKLLSDNVRIDKYQPVRVGVVDLYAVQLSLHHPDGSSQPNLPDRMTLLTDASGTIQFGMVADLATGQEAALSQATEITRLRLPDALPKQLATGTGSHDVIFVSDPFCPFCRQAASYLLESLDRIASLKIVHLPLPMHPGADAATWIMEYATERQSADVDPLAVMRYAYAQLRIPAQGTSPAKTLSRSSWSNSRPSPRVLKPRPLKRSSTSSKASTKRNPPIPRHNCSAFRSPALPSSSLTDSQYSALTSLAWKSSSAPDLMAKRRAHDFDLPTSPRVIGSGLSFVGSAAERGARAVPVQFMGNGVLFGRVLFVQRGYGIWSLLVRLGRGYIRSAHLCAAHAVFQHDFFPGAFG